MWHLLSGSTNATGSCPRSVIGDLRDVSIASDDRSAVADIVKNDWTASLTTGATAAISKRLCTPVFTFGPQAKKANTLGSGCTELRGIAIYSQESRTTVNVREAGHLTRVYTYSVITSYWAYSERLLFDAPITAYECIYIMSVVFPGVRWRWAQHWQQNCAGLHMWARTI